MPVLQTHGTDDAPIDQDASQTAIDWWIDFNGASTTPEITALTNTFPANGTTVDTVVYAGGEAVGDGEHLRNDGGGHVWPGADGESDVDVAERVWRFLRRYDVNGRIDE